MDENPVDVASRHLRLQLAVVVIATAHGGLALIGLFDRLQFTRPPQFEFLEVVANNAFWVPGHALCAVALFVGPRRRALAFSRVLSASFAVMAVWSFFTLLWGLWPSGPVMLAAPVLGFAVATGAHLLSRVYLEAAMSHGSKG